MAGLAPAIHVFILLANIGGRLVLRIVARITASLAAAAMLAACGHFDRDKVSIGIGTAAYAPQAASPYAWLYLPYARMASLNYDASRNGGCPRAGAMTDTAAMRRLAALNDEWECWRALPDYKDCSNPANCRFGLGFHVWRRRDCGQAVIAFRGTDRGDRLDWLANLRWILPGDEPDQYEQVNRLLRRVVGDIRTRCPLAPIVAAGHSLGGGLAQFAGYRNRHIAYVYAFDPSPVTAYFDVGERTLERTTQKLGIDRIYESGEVLSLPRYLASGVFPTSQCRPFVRIARFNVIGQRGLIFGHSIDSLADGLRQAAVPPKPRMLPTGFRQARDCIIVFTDRGAV